LIDIEASLQNLIFTDYLAFHLYINGEFKTKIEIAEIKNGKIVPIQNNFSTFIDLIKDFCLFEGQTIKSSSTLAAMMAKKARMLENIIEAALLSDIKKEETSSLRDQMDAFQKILIHDIKPKEFADIYAQTIAYGMFAARFHDKTLETFSRQEAAELIPKSNPFLRSLFSYIAGPDIDDRIKWIVESLAEIFRSADVASLLKDFGKATQTQDPIIHFYETFLTEYDPALRKARGVWYTPHPVVNFIIRAIDDILKSEFGIKEGIADNSMIDIDVKQPGEKKSTKKKVHRVQFLDPATGTGTFIAELIRQVYQKFQGQEGIWSNYVENHLIPRLHGFEILMASYAMAHLKIDMLLQETGFKPTKNQRLKIYLTNSLEEYHEDDRTLFALARWLSEEAQQANDVKRDTPVMVVMGNPPYSGESNNKGEWIMNLMEDYKKEPGGKEKLKERNPKWIMMIM
jgi:predicted helicase